MKIATYKGRKDGEASRGVVPRDAEGKALTLLAGEPVLLTEAQAKVVEGLDGFDIDLKDGEEGSAPRADRSDLAPASDEPDPAIGRVAKGRGAAATSDDSAGA